MIIKQMIKEIKQIRLYREKYNQALKDYDKMVINYNEMIQKQYTDYNINRDKDYKEYVNNRDKLININERLSYENKILTKKVKKLQEYEAGKHIDFIIGDSTIIRCYGKVEKKNLNDIDSTYTTVE